MNNPPLEVMLEKVRFCHADIAHSHCARLHSEDVTGELQAVGSALQKKYTNLGYLTGSVTSLLEHALIPNREGHSPVVFTVFAGDAGYVIRIRSPEPVYANFQAAPEIARLNPILRKGLRYSVDEDGCAVNLMKVYERSEAHIAVRAATAGSHAADECYVDDLHRH